MLTALLRAWFTLAQQKRSLENLVDLDPLTNLRNRRSLHSSIERRCLAGKPFALLYIDLDKFKNINDTYGHQVGDGFLLDHFGQRPQLRLPRGAGLPGGGPVRAVRLQIWPVVRHHLV